MIVIELPDEAATAALAARLRALARRGRRDRAEGRARRRQDQLCPRLHPRPRRRPARCRARPSRWCRSTSCRPRRSGISTATGCVDPEEAWELGIEDAFVDGISLIEWPERFGALLPARRLEITSRSATAPGARRRHRRRPAGPIRLAMLRRRDMALTRLAGFARQCRQWIAAAAERHAAMADFLAARAGPGSIRSGSPAMPRSVAITGSSTAAAAPC